MPVSIRSRLDLLESLAAQESKLLCRRFRLSEKSPHYSPVAPINLIMGLTALMVAEQEDPQDAAGGSSCRLLRADNIVEPASPPVEECPGGILPAAA